MISNPKKTTKFQQNLTSRLQDMRKNIKCQWEQNRYFIKKWNFLVAGNELILIELQIISPLLLPFSFLIYFPLFFLYCEGKEWSSFHQKFHKASYYEAWRQNCFKELRKIGIVIIKLNIEAHFCSQGLYDTGRAITLRKWAILNVLVPQKRKKKVVMQQLTNKISCSQV